MIISLFSFSFYAFYIYSYFVKKTAAIVFFILALLFIWTQSTLSPKVSSAESDFVMRIVRPFLEVLVGKGNVTSNMVRKIAHYAEFAMLGLFSVFFVYREEGKVIVQILISILICLAVASIDETIQIFTNRGPAVKDVVIDMSGAVVGIVIGLLC